MNILTLTNLYVYETVKYIIKNLPVLLLRKDFHDHNTRYNNSLDSKFRLSKSQKSHIFIGLKIYNKIQSRIELYPVNVGIKKLRLWLGNNPFYKLDEFFNIKECNILFQLYFNAA